MSTKTYDIPQDIISKSVRNRTGVDPVEPANHPCGYPRLGKPYKLLLLVDSLHTKQCAYGANTASQKHGQIGDRIGVDRGGDRIMTIFSQMGVVFPQLPLDLETLPEVGLRLVHISLEEGPVGYTGGQVDIQEYHFPTARIYTCSSTGQPYLI